METQSGARTPLVDPFGRELEEWLRDAPATRAPYLADLVVPPVTGPVQRPDAVTDAAPEVAATTEPTDASAFRRPRDRARHAACGPSFPEPPARLALRIEDLAVEVSASSGRTTIERIVLLEDEVRRRDEDLARLAAWEATVADSTDPEVAAAREFARSVFADLLADAAAEADRRERSAARRAATGPIAQALVAPKRPAQQADAPAPELVLPEVAPEPVPERDEPVRPAPGLLAVTPVSANTRPTPLIQPATGPTVVDRAAFAAALTAHVGATASTPVVLPESARPTAEHVVETDPAVEDVPAAGWWQRLVARIVRAFRRG